MRENVDRLFVHCDQVVALTGARDRAGGGWCRPADEDLGVVEDGGLAVRDGRIVAVATTAELRDRYESAQVLSLRGFSAVPGLVDVTFSSRDLSPADVLGLGTTALGVAGEGLASGEGEPQAIGWGATDESAVVVASEPLEIEAALDREARAIVGGRGVSVANAERLAAAECVVVVGVDDVLRPGLDAAPARELIDAGCVVALAPGSSSTAPRSLRATVGIAMVGLSLTFAEALVGVTRNAAVALGAEREIGGLGSGMRADFVVLDTAGHRSRAGWREGGEVPYVVLAGEPVVAHVRRSQLENPW